MYLRIHHCCKPNKAPHGRQVWCIYSFQNYDFSKLCMKACILASVAFTAVTNNCVLMHTFKSTLSLGSILMLLVSV